MTAGERGDAPVPAVRQLDLPPLREVIPRHGLSARRPLGQHFLLDLNLTRRIVRAAGDLTGQTVIEVGPGPGGLTRALLESAASKVIAIERDRRCIAALQELEVAYGSRLTVIPDDAMRLHPVDLCPAPRRIVANLPYNIATRLLLLWLDDPRQVESMTLMFQTEVAQRLAASPRRKAYGRLTVLTQWLCEVQREFDIPARAFTPPPKVNSTVISIRPRAEPAAPAPRAVLERVTAAAFGQRRKMLRSSLGSLGDPVALTEQAGVPLTARADDLSVEDYCRLACALATATRANA